MRILLTNDDGIQGAGLWAIAHALKNHEVIIAAPMNQQSGMAHALNVLREIEYKRFDNSNCEAWIFDGTPTDCVKIYLEGMNDDKKFDALISGINDGANLATDVLYSGTVGAALEGFLHAIPTLAVSRDRNSEIPFDTVAKFTVNYLEKILSIKRGSFLHNINFPKKFRADKAEFIATRLGHRDYINAFTSRTDDAGRTYFQIGGTAYDVDDSEGTDIHAVNLGYVSVTPLHADNADYEELIELRKIFRG